MVKHFSRLTGTTFVCWLVIYEPVPGVGIKNSHHVIKNELCDIILRSVAFCTEIGIN